MAAAAAAGRGTAVGHLLECGGQVTGDPFLRMDGQAVFKFAVRVLADVAEEVCHNAGIQTGDVDWLIPHQANIRIIEQALHKWLKVSHDRVYNNLDRYGNKTNPLQGVAVQYSTDEVLYSRTAPTCALLFNCGGRIWAATGKTVVFVTHSIPEAVFLSTRIVVMSPRPGRILDVIEVDLPADRPLDIRETPEFLAVAQRVREGLRAGHSYDDD